MASSSSRKQAAAQVDKFVRRLSEGGYISQQDEELRKVLTAKLVAVGMPLKQNKAKRPD